MAVDEAVLERYASSEREMPPTLRLYGWSPAALTLGRGQDPPDERGRAYLSGHGIDLVRRPTGGGAVLHDAERTYAIVGTLRTASFPRGVLDTYRRIARALERAFGALGVEVIPRIPDSAPRERAAAACFDITSAYELTWQNKKLVGSAQLRRRHGFLQHGAIPVRSEVDRLRRAIGRVGRGHRHGGLAEAMGTPLDEAKLDEALVEAFGREFGVTIGRSVLTPEETERATRLRCWKYLSAEWTLRGRIGARERRWEP